MVTRSPELIERRLARKREYNAQKRKDGWKDRNRHPTSIDWAFIGVDGEGGEVVQDDQGRWIDGPEDENNHRYLMLRAGSDLLINRDRGPLSSVQCFDFLCDLDRSKGRIYVGYFFDYDVSHILRDLPAYKIERLFDRPARSITRNGMTYTYPVDWEGYEFDYMPRKEFKIRRQGEQRYLVINDVGSFFQCAFLKALQDWKIGTDDQLAHIADGKAGRLNFGALTDDTIRYNGIEIDLLEQLMTEFRSAVIAAHMVPAKWQGPGQIASAIFKRQGMIKSENVQDQLPAALLAAANASYYGGRFEITAIGRIPGPVYQHDINSAYPYAETRLPCLDHGTWEQRYVDDLPDDDLFLARGSFTHKEKVNLYGLPHRNSKGNISWPGSAGEGWYWSHEIRSAVHQSFKIKEAWVYECHCTCQPFAFIPALYQERAKLGKEAKGIAIKLGLNSTYGKLCQSVGSPVYSNPIYASLITSYTRSQLYDKCVKLGVDKVIMLATDGIFTTSDVDHDHSPKMIMHDGDHEYTLKPLGDWEVTTYDKGIFVVQPGLYFLPGGKKPKTRGVPMSKVIEHRQQFYDVYNKIEATLRYNRTLVREVKPRSRWDSRTNDWKPPRNSVFQKNRVAIPLRSLINLRLADHLKRHDDLGQWLPVEKKISFAWNTKRADHFYSFEIHNGWISVQPIMEVRRGREHDYDLEPTTPYSKAIGAMIDRQRLDQGFDLDPDAPEMIFIGEE